MPKAAKSRAVKPIKVPLHTVMAVMRTIHKKGKARHFMVAAHKAGAFINVHPKTMKFFQKYVQANSIAARSAADTGACPEPYHCPNAAP
jgi:hypothetical protein